jgi:K+/H+ antiporter YhaU regulatory subunit KhtT
LEALAGLKVESVAVPPSSPIIGKACPHVDGAVLIAIRRDDRLLEAPAAVPLQGADVVYLVGDRDASYAVAAAIDPSVGDPRTRHAPSTSG